MQGEKRKYDIPIRMSGFDDSSSITSSQENTQQKTPSENLEMDKMMTKCSPKKSKTNIKYSHSKETEGLKDSSDMILPSVKEGLINDKHNSCKSISEIQHYTYNHHNYHPNPIQERLNKERQMKYLKSTIGSSIGFEKFKDLEVTDFQPPRKAS